MPTTALAAGNPASVEAVDEEGKDTRIYECAILYLYPLSQKEEKETLDGVSEIFRDAGAKEIAKDLWGRRGLAYPIKGREEGCFAVYHYEMDPAMAKEVNETLHIAHGVIRHLLIKPPKGYEIVKFSEEYEQWTKDRREVEEHHEIEKEKELQRRVVEKAKRKAKRVEEEKQTKVEDKEAKPAFEEDKLTEELEKLISDDELNL